MPDLELNKWGYIVADEHGRTSVKGVYAGGDIVTGMATVIQAMGAGRMAATAIHEYLMGNGNSSDADDDMVGVERRKY